MYKVSQLDGCSLEIPRKYVIKLLRKLGKLYTLLEKKKKTKNLSGGRCSLSSSRVFFQPSSWLLQSTNKDNTHCQEDTTRSQGWSFTTRSQGWSFSGYQCSLIGGRNNGKELNVSYKNVKWTSLVSVSVLFNMNPGGIQLENSIMKNGQ